MTRFVDTNILLYAVSLEQPERRKRDAAVELLQSLDLGLSAQVMAEFYAQATRPSRARRLEHADARAFLEGLKRFPVQALTADLVLEAADTSARFQISYWDAAIIEAARTLGCDVVLTEDLNGGQDYDGVRVEDPFADL